MIRHATTIIFYFFKKKAETSIFFYHEAIIAELNEKSKDSRGTDNIGTIVLSIFQYWKNLKETEGQW